MSIFLRKINTAIVVSVYTISENAKGFPSASIRDATSTEACRSRRPLLSIPSFLKILRTLPVVRTHPTASLAIIWVVGGCLKTSGDAASEVFPSACPQPLQRPQRREFQCPSRQPLLAYLRPANRTRP